MGGAGGAFDEFELARHVGVFAVMGEAVVAECDAFDERTVQ